MKMGLAGRYVISKQKVMMQYGVPVLDDQGNQIPIGNKTQVAAFDNLITDTGLNALGTRDPLRYCFVSSDNTEPLVTDSEISGLLGATNKLLRFTSESKQVAVAPYSFTTGKTFEFIAGVGTGNISKVAVGRTANGQDIFSTQLIKGDNGANLTITKFADEILEITYLLTTYVSGDDYTGNITISGVSYDIVMRLARLSSWIIYNPNIYINDFSTINVYTDDIKDVNQAPTAFTGPNSADFSKTPYIDNSLQLEYFITLPPDRGNMVSGIKSAVISGNSYRNFYTQVSFTPPIPKTDTKTLTLPPFIVSWGRYEPATP